MMCKQCYPVPPPNRNHAPDTAPLSTILPLLPHEREQRVAAIQHAIAAGGYHVPGDQIAERWLETLVAERLAAAA